MAEQARARTSKSYTASLRKFLCPQDKATLADLKKRNVKITAYDEIYFEDPYYDGSQWTTKRTDGLGSEGGGEIHIVRESIAEDASSLFHEAIHTRQPATMEWRDKEYEAYTLSEEWRIKRGLPPEHPEFRVTKGGRTTVNRDFIKALVDEKYPGVTVPAPSTSAPGTPPDENESDRLSGPDVIVFAPDGAPPPTAAPERIIGRTATGDTVLQRGDKTIYDRPPREGDTFAGREVSVPKEGIPVNVDELQCR